MTTAGVRLERGQKVGEYEIVRKLGLGGMGVVYEGHHPLIGKRVAVKVLLPSLSENEELVGRFLSEARAVNAIRHRGIVDIFSFGQLEDGSHYFVMEYLEGHPFDQLIRERAPLPPVEALRYFEETLEALGAAHEAGIIHRDIKPSNLFLVDTGRGQPYVKLLDFGIAKLDAQKGQATPQTRASVVIGTPNYISPEQARGQAISPATDLYAMGCVLFELLTGHLPFETDNPLEALFLHVEQPPPPPSKFLPALPPQLDELVLWILEKQPASRPGSAEELRSASQALRLELGDSTRVNVRAPPTPPPNRPPSVSQRSAAASSGATRVSRPEQATRTFHGPVKPAPGRESRQRGLWVGALALVAVLGAGGWIALRPSTPVLAPLPVAAPEKPSPRSAAVAAGSSTPPSDTPPSARPPSGSAVVAPASGMPPSAPPSSGSAVVAPSSGTPPSAPPSSGSASVARPAEAAPLKAAAVPTSATELATSAAASAPSHASKGLTASALSQRIRLLERKLAAKEAKTGDPDEVLRQFLAQASKDAARAETPAQRRDVWQLLDDLQQQLEAK